MLLLKPPSHDLGYCYVMSSAVTQSSADDHWSCVCLSYVKYTAVRVAEQCLRLANAGIVLFPAQVTDVVAQTHLLHSIVLEQQQVIVAGRDLERAVGELGDLLLRLIDADLGCLEVVLA